MKLLYTKRSPYARKVRIVALEKDIPLDVVEEDLTKKSQTLISSNPVGKIPVLILDNGEALADSPVLCEYLDGLNDKPVLIPKEAKARFKILNLAAMADGLMDVTVGCYMEKVRHPNDFNQVFISQQEEIIKRCLSFFEENIKELNNLTLFPIAVASALGYLNFRLPQLGPKQKFPKLANWFEEFSKRPSMQSTLPG